MRSIIGVALAVIPIAGSAQEEPAGRVPDVLQGIYVGSDTCIDPDATHWVIGPQADFFLSHTDWSKRFFMTMVYDRVPRTGDGRYVLDIGDGNFSVISVEEDGRISSAFIEGAEQDADGTGKTPERLGLDDVVDGLNAGDLQPEESTSYRRCDRIAEQIMLPYVELIPFVRSDLLPVCRSGSLTECSNAVFDYLDTQGDGEIRPAEIARGLRIATMFNAGLAYSAGDMSNGEITSMLAMMPTYPLVGHALVAQVDYDGSGGISVPEIGVDVQHMPGVMSALADLPGVDDLPTDRIAGMLTSLQGLIP